jgi:hypothetical protein
MLAGQPDHSFAFLEAVDEVTFGCGSIFLAATIGHRLSAAGLLKWVLDLAAASLEGPNGSDADFRKKASK